MTFERAFEAGTTITFRGRGRGLRLGNRVIVLVCPLCSQRNARQGAERGICEWCAYAPSPDDVEPAEATQRALG